MAVRSRCGRFLLLLTFALWWGCSKRPDQVGAPGASARVAESPAARVTIAQLRQILGSSPASHAARIRGFTPNGDRVRPLIDTAEIRRSRAPANVELPRFADGEVTVEDRRTRVGVGFRVLGAPSWPITVADQHAVYDERGAKQAWVQRVNVEGVEDYVVFRHRPEREELRYRVDVRRVAGIRLVSNLLEFLDRDGAPRLRVEEPYVVDRNGERRAATLEVLGCAYDADPRMPWGRPVRAPGASHCELVIRWNSERLTYPLVLDPVWSTTCGPVENPHGQAARLLDGRVIMVPAGVDRAAIYDPNSRTWGFTEKGPRVDGNPVVIKDGRVLTGFSYFDPATGKWGEAGFTVSGTPPHKMAGIGGVAIALSDGRAIMNGGRISPHDTFPGEATFGGKAIFDPATSTWNATWDGGFAEELHASVNLADGRVLSVGGTFEDYYPCYPPPDRGDDYFYRSGSSARAAIYDPKTDVYTSVAPMLEARSNPSAVLLPSGKVLVVGAERCDALCGTCERKRNKNAAEIYDPATDEWQAAGAELDSGKLVLLSAGDVLLGGPRPALFESSTGRWFAVPDYLDAPRYAPELAALDAGEALVVGGRRVPEAYAAWTWPTAEVYEGGHLGEACTASAGCSSGNCVDGVCCDSACTGSCEACSAAKKGAGAVDGRCGPILEGNDPDDECAAIGSGECRSSGACDGKRACGKTVGQPCGARQCSDFYTIVHATCDDTGACANSKPHECHPGTCTGTSPSAACTLSCNREAGNCAPDAQCSISGRCFSTRYDPAPPGTKSIGERCEANAECQNGACVDGVCCNDSTCGACNACRSDLKQDGGPDGVCAAAKAGTNPHDFCMQSLFDCKSNGLCDGAGKCGFAAAGTACGDTTCQDATTMVGRVCDAQGQCIDGTGSCGNFACANGTCGVCCGSSRDCAAGFVCKDCDCVTALTLGQACSSADQCASGNCVDGRCCDSACSGLCEACDIAGHEGTCSAVTGVCGETDGGAGAAGTSGAAGTAGTGGTVGAAGTTGTAGADTGGAGGSSNPPPGTDAGTGASAAPPPPESDDSGCSVAERGHGQRWIVLTALGMLAWGMRRRRRAA